MKVLVTGGAGYIGSVTADVLLRAGHGVTVLDNLSRGRRDAVPADAAFEEADLLDFPRTREIFARRRPDAVLHFAGHSEVEESLKQPWLYLGENVTAGLHALRATAEHGVRRFVLSSTANLLDARTAAPLDETAAVAPASPYGESKWILERALAWAGRIHGIRGTSLRYFNAAGATAERGEDRGRETRLIPLLLQVAAGRRASISVFGTDYDTPDGSCVRDFVHVSDLADAHLLALDAGGPLYHVGNGRGFSVKEVVEAARRTTGRAIPAVDAPRRPGDPPRLVADATKIRRELGWAPKIPELDRIVESAWRWMRSR